MCDRLKMVADESYWSQAAIQGWWADVGMYSHECCCVSVGYYDYSFLWWYSLEVLCCGTRVQCVNCLGFTTLCSSEPCMDPSASSTWGTLRRPPEIGPPRTTFFALPQKTKKQQNTNKHMLKWNKTPHHLPRNYVVWMNWNLCNKAKTLNH